MNEIIKYNGVDKKRGKFEKLNCIKMNNFNSEWSHAFRNEQNQGVTDKDRETHNTLAQISKQEIVGTSRKFMKNGFKHTDEIYTTSQIHPKKKAFSQLLSFWKLDFLNLQSRFSKPGEQVFQANIQSNRRNFDQQQLSLKSIRLKALKLSEIKTTSRQNRIVQTIKLENLRPVNIHQRVKTMKYTPEKGQNYSLSSQITTQILKSKAKNIPRFNKKLFQDKNQTQISLNQQKQSLTRISRKTQKIKQPNKNIKNMKCRLSQFNKIQKTKNCNDGNKSQQNCSLKQKAIQKQIFIQNQSSQTSLPKIQIYDKKMKIGRKKKSQENRIRAMLLKILQKTKGTDYIAQRGTSQKTSSPHHSLSQNNKSSSNNSSKDHKKQEKLILINDKSDKSPSKKFSIKKAQLQKLRKSLNPRNKVAESHDPTGHAKNKKYVEMVREVQRNHRQLQQIQEQRGVSKIDEESSNSKEGARKLDMAAQQTSQNEFLADPTTSE